MDQLVFSFSFRFMATTSKISVEPSNIEAVPTVNFLIEYLFNLLGKNPLFINRTLSTFAHIIPPMYLILNVRYIYFMYLVCNVTFFYILTQYFTYYL